MKRKSPFHLSLLICSLFFLPRIVLAQNQAKDAFGTKNVMVEEGEVIDRDFFAAGETITISGVINGDAFLAGGNISVDGKINGDLLAGGGMMTISGEVSDDVRVGGGNILISGTIGKNLTVGGGNVTISNEAKVGGSLLAFGGSLVVNGPIGRDALAFASQANFGNQIGGDLKGTIESLTLSSEAQILGNLEYESPQKAVIGEGATVFGKITYKPKEEKPLQPEGWLKKIPLGFGKKIRPFFAFTSFILNLILGLLFISFFPKRAAGMIKTLASRPWASLGVGILTPIIFGLAMVLLTISLVGIPLMLILLLLFSFLVYFSKIFTILFLGDKFLNRSYVWSFSVGLLVYYLLKLVAPGGLMTLISLIMTSFGLGAFVLDQKSLRQRPSKKAKNS